MLSPSGMSYVVGLTRSYSKMNMCAYFNTSSLLGNMHGKLCLVTIQICTKATEMHRSMYTLSLQNVLSDVAWDSTPYIFSVATQSLKEVTLMFFSLFSLLCPLLWSDQNVKKKEEKKHKRRCAWV